MTRPAVLVWQHDAPAECLRQLTAGLEEEGVPFLVESHRGAAAELAEGAAAASTVDIGIGVDAHGRICAQHAKLTGRVPLAPETAEHARLLGHNAARLAVGIPLKRKEQ
ncbi:glycerol dehydratase reactivase beta/small subunit family protein [Sciscionella marina]|uniref:glycerol dehydratase reactivase beta/small subunit family protein n=1 Tax=Sciscionella marina TaxID=508770 RepID=UPI000376C80D|nr:glycerol dehydratase reactivase beta/small subunit family protein [Sciscionella marina]